MKAKKRFLSLVLFGGIICIGLTQCAKDGAEGPAGTNGTNGVDASVVSTADQTAYNSANGLKGGLAYNEFFIPQTDFPQPADTLITNHPDFFRCASCHGMDLLGVNGAAIANVPTATTPNVSSINLNTYVASHNIKQIFDAVKHTGGRLRQAITYNSLTSLNSIMPDYGLIMGDGMIWNIVKYLKENAVNTDKLYDLTTSGAYPGGVASFTNIGKDGNAIKGKVYYNANCTTAGCHNSTGSIPSSVETVGSILRAEPANAYHLIKFGFPGTAMINLPYQLTAMPDTTLQNLFKAISDTTAFPN
jgi:mono/diheme cytochrome c family protein